MILKELKFFLPEITLILSSIYILLYGIFFKDNENLKKNIFYITIIAFLLALYFCLNIKPNDNIFFNKLLINNEFTQFFKILVLFGTLAVVLLSYNYLNDLGILKSEFFFLISLATVGSLVIISANNIISMYLGLELQSVCLYILATYRSDYLKSSESGVKYFILGALSSAILLYGISLIYASTNSMDFYEISKKIIESSDISSNSLIISTGFVLVLSGLFFKIAVVPFHMWAPDVYEGSPTNITAFFTTIPKIGALAILIKFLNIPFSFYQENWIQILYIISIVSMLLGSIAAINQSNIKRLLAYSSIGHMGFILLGTLAANQFGIKTVQLYLLIYTVTILGFFTCLLSIKDEKEGKYLEEIKSFSGLLKKNSFLAFSMLIMLFSLAGIPPIAGFFSKLYVLLSIIDKNLYLIAIIAVFSMIISAFYYLKIIKIVFFDQPLNPIHCEIAFSSRIIIYLSIILNIFFIFFSSKILDFLETSSNIN